MEIARTMLSICTMLAIAGTAHADGPLTLPFQLTHVEKFDATLSPDGQRIVFGSVFEGRQQLLVMNRDGSGERLLTRMDVDHADPAWSPVAEQIAFVAVDGDSRRIHVMNLDGSDDRVLTPEDQRAIHPRWSPDGRRIIYCTDDDVRPPKKNQSDIRIIDLESGRIRVLISGGVNTYPSWSPDMKKVVFRRMLGEMNSEVFVADADGSNVRNLSDHPAFDGWPDWSPDGRRIAFASNRRGRGYQIHVMDADGSHVQLVANTAGRATGPRWSPDGKRIYFTNCIPKDYGVDCQIMVAALND